MHTVAESARKLKAFVGHTQVKQLARDMIFRMAIAFITHRGRMSCSVVAGSVASDPDHAYQRRSS
ncbi:MAG: hypothetical protein RJB11_1754 [Planctomycetota bacterium]